MEEIKSLFQSLFSSIPSEWYTKNNMEANESYSASVVYSFLASLGFNLKTGVSSTHMTAFPMACGSFSGWYQVE